MDLGAVSIEIRKIDRRPKVDSQRQLASYLGKSESWISEILALLRLRTPLQLKLRNSETKVSFDAISKIARVEDPQQQEDLLDRALGGTSSAVIRKEIQETVAAALVPQTRRSPNRTR